MPENISKSLIEVQEVSKSYFGVTALDKVSFDLRHGEVHALVGENGAGKSTLAKIIAGVVKKDDGKVLKNGSEIDPQNTKEVLDLGISIIHQEFNLVPALSIAQNIFLGKECMKNVFIEEEACIIASKELLAKVGLTVSPKTLLKNLSVAEQQLVEIAKCLSYNSEILIMDEPTAPLSKNEVDRLYNIINSLKEKGVSIIYVSHRLEEIFTISDRITVLRDGEKVGTYDTKQLDEKGLINLMVGRDLSNMYSHVCSVKNDKDAVLKVHEINKKPVLKNISFTLKKGEILGIAGLMGAGRTELVRCIFGADPIDSGEIEINGSKVTNICIDTMKKHGVGFITEDRKKDGIISNMSIIENMTMGTLKNVSQMGLIKARKERKVVKEMIAKLNIKCPSLLCKIGYLSGGNQQKAILGKWLISSPNILILDEPTRGIDVGAKAEIYSLISNLCQKGLSIIMVSSELPEILGMCDRILVMSEGTITAEFMKDDASEAKIMEAATLRKLSLEV